jgi:hypothetical protein
LLLLLLLLLLRLMLLLLLPLLLLSGGVYSSEAFREPCFILVHDRIVDLTPH